MQFKSLFQPLKYKSLRDFKFYARHYMTVRRIYRGVLQELDLDRLRELKAKHAASSKPPLGFKYFDYPCILRLAVYRAIEIDLHRREPLSILDIGTGAGYFPLVCRHLGHTVVATDLAGVEVYDDLSQLCGVDRREWYVSPFAPAPDFGQRFDLVTAFMIGFNKVRKEGQGMVSWGTEQWGYFLSDLATSQLTEKGEIYLAINKYKGGEGLSAWDEELFAFFHECGAELPTVGRVHFRSVERLRQKAPAQS